MHNLHSLSKPTPTDRFSSALCEKVPNTSSRFYFCACRWESESQYIPPSCVPTTWNIKSWHVASIHMLSLPFQDQDCNTCRAMLVDIV